MKLEGKTAIVTGGAMGIGLATVKRLLEAGVIVTVWDINEEAMQNLKNSHLNIPAKLFIHKCDVTDQERVKELSKIAFQEMGRIDFLINNAGYVRGGGFCDLPVDIWVKTVDINLNSIFYTTANVLPLMRQNNFGHIVNISSASGLLGVADLSAYAATKWAVWGLTESLRYESLNKTENIYWSSVHPSYLKEGLFEGAKLNILGNLIVPQIKSHDVIAKAIVHDCLTKKKTLVLRPRSLRLALILRGILSDYLFRKLLIIMGVPKSMSNWKGREH
jgi:all-trans-retinol dehydrogenase (NAD+)